MDRAELQAALRRAGVPASDYLLLGLPREPGPLREAHYVLHEATADGCLVTVRERGSEETVALFPTEREACEFLYEHLTRPTPEPPPGSAETIADLLARREEIQRRAWEQYDQARRDHH
jgi:hypothetical protein